ncbi:MAG: hypothetical protein V9G04_14950 [Nocardioides sp.]|jgi:beta-fructofuranosidase
MFDLDDRWVWDFWIADDGSMFHLFFLQAPRSLGDPDLRHDHASVGHAVSPDLTTWTEVGLALSPPETGFDDRTIWTGSVAGRPGAWRMFYTGRTHADGGAVQRIGAAVSSDLSVWAREEGWPLEADPRWYEKDSAAHRAWRWHDHATTPEEHFRDPFAVQDAKGTWHLYVTARHAGTGPGRGAVGHLVQDDEGRWQVAPPLTSGAGPFEQAEVISVQQVEDRWVLLFSCLGPEIVGGRPGDGGVWSVPVGGVGEPVDLEAAVRLCDEGHYVGQLVRDRAGRWQFLAFRNFDDDGDFVGGVIDPVPVRWRADGAGLELSEDPC